MCVGENPVIVLEVGVSQKFQSLEERAKKWLIGHKVLLVILIDIQIEKVKNEPLSFSSNDDGGSDGPNIPYGLTVGDIVNAGENFKALGEKMEEYYRAQALPKPSMSPMIDLLSIDVYLYHYNKSNKAEIKKEKTSFYTQSGFRDPEITILLSDVGLSTKSPSPRLKLPLSELKHRIPFFLAAQSKKLAHERAYKLLRSRGIITEKDASYDNTPDDTGPSVRFPPGASSPPRTRSRGPPKHRAEDDEQYPTGRKKQKHQNKMANSNLSFSTDQGTSSFASSTNLFSLEVDTDTQGLTTSAQSSFSKAMKTALQGPVTSDAQSAASAEASAHEEPSSSRRGTRTRKWKARAST